VRDAVEVTAGSLPVFCAGSTAPASLNVHFGVNLQRPIDCGGVADIPGDVLMGDSDGVVVIQAAQAEEVVCDGGKQERLETFLKQRVAGSHLTTGTYPPNLGTLQAYEVWKKNPGGEKI
jgi:regulator of RNase E activity RraA